MPHKKVYSGEFKLQMLRLLKSSGKTKADLEQELVASALQMANTQRQPREGVLHHSDRGSQYSAHDYRQYLQVTR